MDASLNPDIFGTEPKSQHPINRDTLSMGSGGPKDHNICPGVGSLLDEIDKAISSILLFSLFSRIMDTQITY